MKEQASLAKSHEEALMADLTKEKQLVVSSHAASNPDHNSHLIAYLLRSLQPFLLQAQTNNQLKKAKQEAHEAQEALESELQRATEEYRRTLADRQEAPAPPCHASGSNTSTLSPNSLPRHKAWLPTRGSTAQARADHLLYEDHLRSQPNPSACYLLSTPSSISAPQHPSTPAYQHPSTPASQHISISAPQHISISASQHLSISVHRP